MVKQFDVIDCLEKNIRNSKNIIFVTYNFDVQFFEDYLLKQIKAPYKKVLILMDFRKYDELVNKKDINIQEAGINYFIYPIHLGRSFHSKFILTFDREKIDLIIGSSNLTKAGCTNNAEIVNSYYVKKDENGSSWVLFEIKKFLETITQRYIQPEEYKHLIKEFFNSKICKQLIKDKGNTDSWFIHNLDDSIWSQVMDLLKEEIKEITIVSPFYGKDIEIYNNLINKTNKISIVLQNPATNFPKEVIKKWFDTNDFELKIYDIQFLDDKGIKEPRALHGKAIIFEAKKHDYLLYGSGNFTRPGLFSSILKDGNIECCILVKGNHGDFNYFFNNQIKLNEIDFDQIEVSSSPDSTAVEYDFFINHATLKKTILTVTLDPSFRTVEPFKCKIILCDLADVEVKEIINNNISVDLGEEISNKLSRTHALYLELITNTNKLISNRLWICNPRNIYEKFGDIEDFEQLLKNPGNLESFIRLFNNYNRIPTYVFHIINILNDNDYMDADSDEREDILFSISKSESQLLENKDFNLPSNKTKEDFVFDIINLFIKRHEKKLDKYIENIDIDKSYDFFERIIISNKLFLLSVISNLKEVSFLSRIRGNFNFLLTEEHRSGGFLNRLVETYDKIKVK